MRTGQHALLRRCAQGIAGLLYPRAANCLCCGDPRQASAADCLCDSCRWAIEQKRLPPSACDRCLSPVRPGKPCAFCASPLMASIDRAFAPYRYTEEVRQLIHAYKFDACNEALPLLCDAMADALPVRDFDCISPVPLHIKRLRQRGVNQALLLSQGLSARTGIPVAELLQRTRYGKPQSLTDAARRKTNVENAFSASKEAKGKRILLVDDVRTSGSTAYACARALRDAGAQSVSLCVCAVVYRKK
ncbi:MAG: ComF family protein [Clostridia bacterium]|nr:ComF family protein [Clostridia bacterium]